MSQKYFGSTITRYLPEFVYGSIDGTVTTFAVIAGIAGAHLDASIVVILGFSNVLADGFSMASSNYLSEKSHRDQHSQSSNTQAPFKTALATFVSFIGIGSIPIIAYLLAPFIPYFNTHQFMFAGICTAITFTGIGAARGIIANKHPLKASIETLVIGIIAAGVAYGAGSFLEKILIK